MPNPKTAQQIRTGLGSHRSFLVELLYGHADGHRYWLWLHFSPVVPKTDPHAAFVVVGTDVTGRKQAEEELLRVSRRNESLLELIGEGIFLIDAQGIITYLNPAGARLTGWEAAELIGQPLNVLVHQLKLGKVVRDHQGEPPDLHRREPRLPLGLRARRLDSREEPGARGVSRRLRTPDRDQPPAADRTPRGARPIPLTGRRRTGRFR